MICTTSPSDGYEKYSVFHEPRGLTSTSVKPKSV